MCCVTVIYLSEVNILILSLPPHLGLQIKLFYSCAIGCHWNCCRNLLTAPWLCFADISGAHDDVVIAFPWSHGYPKHLHPKEGYCNYLGWLSHIWAWNLVFVPFMSFSVGSFFGCLPHVFPLDFIAWNNQNPKPQDEDDIYITPFYTPKLKKPSRII